MIFRLGGRKEGRGPKGEERRTQGRGEERRGKEGR